MSQQKLMIVPVTLHGETKQSFSSPSSKESTTSSICTIKTTNAEIAFYDGVDERIIQTVMRELKHL